MKNQWIDPKIIIGNKATGDYYYPRPALEQQIIDEILKGNHILIAAPRRFGKTSIAIYIANNCPEGCNCIFENIQGIDSETGFYKRFYELMLLSLKNNIKRKEKIKNFFKSIKIKEISATGTITFAGKKSIDYLSEIDNLLPLLQENNLKLVLFIDELPEVLYNLHKTNRDEEAKAILKNIRRWRQMDKTGSLCLVLTGSVGIHHVVKTIENRTTDLNDMAIVDFKPFTNIQSSDFIHHFTKGASVKYSTELSDYLLEKIAYQIPYFINLMLGEINKIAKDNGTPQIDKSHINLAFDNVVKNSDYFKEWKNRLFDYYSSADAAFMNEILVFIAHKGKINIKQLYNLAVKHEKTIAYMDFVDDLIHDGYILRTADDDFIFVSPFLSTFWKRNQPIYDEK